MTDKQIEDNVSNFCLVCYYDIKTNELVRIESYCDNDTSMYSDIDSYRYGYNAEITKPEEIIKQLQRKEQECEELKSLLKVRIEDLCDSCGASSMMPMPCKVYEKTLTEIKEIVKPVEEIYPFCGHILQKISEVEDEHRI